MSKRKLVIVALGLGLAINPGWLIAVGQGEALAGRRTDVALAATTTDEEIVLLDSVGYVRVKDPVVQLKKPLWAV